MRAQLFLLSFLFIGCGGGKASDDRDDDEEWGESAGGGGDASDPFGGSGTTLISSLENQIPSYVKIIDINEDAINLMNKLSNQGLLKFS